MRSKSGNHERSHPTDTASTASKRQGQQRLRALPRLLAAAATAAALSGCPSSRPFDDFPSEFPTGPGCPADLTSSLEAKAVWKQGIDGLVVEIQILDPAQPDVSFDGSPSSTPPSNADLLSVSLADQDILVLEVAPTGGDFATVTVSVSCASGPGKDVRVTLDMRTSRASPREGDEVAVVLRDT